MKIGSFHFSKTWFRYPYPLGYVMIKVELNGLRGIYGKQGFENC